TIDIKTTTSVPASSRLRVWLFSLVGFVVGTLPFVIYLATTHALSFYWRYVWDWGTRYARYYSPAQVIVTALGQTTYYFLLNNTLLVALVFVAVTTYKRARRVTTADAETAVGAVSMADAGFRADVALLLWFAVSFAAMSVGGRFFGHYFLQVLPALCLIGGRGLAGILAALAGREPGVRRRRRVWLALLLMGFTITDVSFPTHTVHYASSRPPG